MAVLSTSVMTPVAEQLVRDIHFAAAKTVTSVIRDQKLQKDRVEDVLALSKGSTVSISFWPLGLDTDASREQIKGQLSKWGPLDVSSYPDPLKDRILRVTFLNPSAACANGYEVRSAGVTLVTVMWVLLFTSLVMLVFFLVPYERKERILNLISPRLGERVTSFLGWCVNATRGGG